MVPVPRCLELLSQQLVQLLPHLDDTSGHCLDISLPLLKQLWVVEDQRDLYEEGETNEAQ